jgi:hypothetical protein
VLFPETLPITLPFRAISYAVAPATASHVTVALFVDGTTFTPVT